MTITIRLQTDNAAFTDKDKTQEIRRILATWFGNGCHAGTLRDINGNTVGSVKVVGR